MSERSERRRKQREAAALLKAKARNPNGRRTTATRKDLPPGSRNGRPRKDVKDYVLQEEARARTPEALEAIVQIMLNSSDEPTILNAAKLIIERAYGKPKQEMDLQVSKVEKIVLTPMTMEEATAGYLRMCNAADNSIDIDFSKVQDRKPREPQPGSALYRAATPQPRIEKPPAPAVAPATTPVEPVARKRYVPPSQVWQDPSVVAVTDNGVGQDVQLRSIGDHADFDKHEHKPLPDSTCARCRALWVAS